QNKDELVIGLSDGERQRYIRANLSPANTCLGFPEDFKRSKKNNVSLFPDLISDTVLAVNVLEFERAFLLRFSSGRLLLFKLHGSRSNILLYPQEEDWPPEIFRNELKEDKDLRIAQLQNPLVLDWNRFAELEGNAAQFLPTLGKVARQRL